jgi:hypothetical protein
MQKNLKYMPEKMLYQDGMTWQFGKSFGHNKSLRIYRWNIFSM